MIAHLVRKELARYLLDTRFVLVFVLCALLSAWSMYAGTRHYLRQQRAYSAISESNRLLFEKEVIEDGSVAHLTWLSYPWNRPPEVLSPIEYGLSGSVGHEARIGYRTETAFQASPFEADPDLAYHGVLDLAFIVKFVLSLVVLLFTHDAICGEKDEGTLRLTASFPVARSTLALAKLAGAVTAILIPLLFSFLLAGSVLALSPGIGLQGGDWGRLVALIAAFCLYLAVFAAFGLWGSALTRSRVVAFLGLLLLWTGWVLVIPNLSVDAARSLSPVDSYYEFRRSHRAARWDTGVSKDEARVSFTDAYWGKVEWSELSEGEREAVQQGWRDEMYDIERRWDQLYLEALIKLEAERRNQIHRQQQVAVALSALSPLSSLSWVSMDLARTGVVQQEQIEQAAATYVPYLTGYVQRKHREWKESIWRGTDMSDFVPFRYRNTEPLADCLAPERRPHCRPDRPGSARIRRRLRLDLALRCEVRAVGRLQPKGAEEG